MQSPNTGEGFTGATPDKKVRNHLDTSGTNRDFSDYGLTKGST